MDEFEAELRARKFVQEIGVSTLPVDLGLYVARVGAKVLLEDLEPDEAGYTMTTPKGPIITLNAQDRAARRRFTQCHEIAHVVLGLPSQHGHAPEWSYARRPPAEICCDVFAAEVLLPYRLFLARAASLPLTFATVHQLASDCFASREAVASRLVATNRLPCAYVLGENGHVRHAIRSSALRAVNGYIPTGTLLPPGSAAHTLRSTREGDGTLTSAGDVWFDGWRDVELEESSIFLPEYDQTLTLLHCTDQDELEYLPNHAGRSEEPEDPDDELLAPLDGHPTFGSRRRKR
ncbi:ImmA/IrrE family metallo-endopeptidase [Metallibacterium scheffleri]|nr:ImmA/IrrE family metallo-endopeptidase [Metallibacterium scheffleri]